MLNYFFWYSIITSFITILYIFPFSNLNAPLDSLLTVLILSSILISIILGVIYKHKFKYVDLDYKKNKYEYLPLIIIVLITIFEFAYARDIPLFSVTIKQVSSYQEFKTIPFLHVFLCMLALYYSTLYMYKAVSYSENRKANIISYALINGMMLLYNMRSFLMFSIFITINLIIAKARRNGKIFSAKRIIIVLFIAGITLFGFGCFGNMRQGYEWNDSSYIERLGMYERWPSFIPKQYMWSYSYITSPLANMNYNIKINNVDYSITGAVMQYIPESFSKRIFTGKHNKCILQKNYFTVSTGYCGTYASMGYIGIIIFWLVTMLFTLLLFRYSMNIEKRKEYLFLLYSIYVFYKYIYIWRNCSSTMAISLFAR